MAASTSHLSNRSGYSVASFFPLIPRLTISLTILPTPCGIFLAYFWQSWREMERYPQVVKWRSDRENPCGRRVSITRPHPHSLPSVRSQAGRRRFDPGRPLHTFPNNSAHLESSQKIERERDGALSPIHHPNRAEGALLSAQREALVATRYSLRELRGAIVLESIYQYVRRNRDCSARRVFAAIINPE